MIPRSLQGTIHLRHLAVMLLCALLGVGQAGAGSMTLLGVGGPAAGGAAVTLDPANKGAGVTLSNGNKTATFGSSDESAKSTTTHSSGKYYLKVTSTSSSRVFFGIGNASSSNSNFVGVDVNGIGWLSSGNIFNNGVVGNAGGWSAGNNQDVAIDLTNGKIWFRTDAGGNVNWNNSVGDNPATNTGGTVLSGVAAGPYYFIVSGGNAGNTLTVDFAPSSGQPSGFGNW